MYCQECPKRANCKDICQELENYLKKKGDDRLYTDRHIRRKEIPFDPTVIDWMSGNIATNLYYGLPKNFDLNAECGKKIDEYSV